MHRWLREWATLEQRVGFFLLNLREVIYSSVFYNIVNIVYIKYLKFKVVELEDDLGKHWVK